ncbi:MAG: AAA family ATPase [Psychrobacillus sp.]|jgi:general secretion pathway protein A
MDKMLDFFGLQKYPFSNGIDDSDSPFASADLNQALAVYKYTVKKKGISCVCGDTGKGVSYSAYQFKKSLASSPHTVKYMNVFHISPRDFYREICRTLDISPDEKSRQARITAIQERADLFQNQGQPLVLILDNAQNIPELAFNDLPCLVSEDYSKSFRMTLILCGSRKLQHRMYDSSETDWKQELLTHYIFEGLSRQEVISYVRHRITIAGGNDDLVQESIFEELYDLSRNGYCKDINNILQEAMLVAFLNKRTVIDLDVLRAAVEHRNL